MTDKKPQRIRAKRLAAAFTDHAKPWADAKSGDPAPAALQEVVDGLFKLASQQHDDDSATFRLILCEFGSAAYDVEETFYDALDAAPDIKGAEPDQKDFAPTAEEMKAARRVEAEWKAAPNPCRDYLLAITPWVANAIRAWCDAEPVGYPEGMSEAWAYRSMAENPLWVPA
jgi:hypothetical protein